MTTLNPNLSVASGKAISFRVHGQPAPQGSKSRNRYGAVYEASANQPAWREAVKTAAMNAARVLRWQTIPRGVPVELWVTFHFARPASHYGTGRNGDVLKPNAPTFKASAPDLSKLVRATEDALTDAGIWHDDAQVSVTVADKRYGQPGADVRVVIA